MTTLPKTLHYASLGGMASGTLHILAPFVSGFSNFSLQLVIFGLIWIGIAIALCRNMRWFSWLVFFMALVGTIVAIANATGTSTVPSWLFSGIAIFDAFVAGALFGHLWMPKKQVA